MARILIIFFVLIIFGANAQEMNASLKVMSYNIRLDYHGDSVKGDGWAQRRREQVIALIRHYDPDLLGVQEAMKNQINDILKELPEYTFIGVGRDDGKEGGEYSAILYKKGLFDVIEENTFWLSETPEKPSKAWDAALPRIVTWGKFRDKKGGKEFYYFNTHFDHIGVTARAESSNLILKKIEDITNDDPVLVTGDFNAKPEAEPYKLMVKKLKDAAEISRKPAYGPEGTFSGFDLKEDQEFPRIDYIFVKDVKVLSFETIADFVNDKFPSDHLPVIAEVNIE